MNPLYYGVAYYDEYMPYERLQEDIQMMKKAGINVVRIAESTWSTLEPQSGIYDFTSIDRVMDAMYEAGISVIIGTPTYAVPTWMVNEHPDILAMTRNGRNQYGPRQNFDITNPKYLYYCERVIRKLMAHVKDHPSIIGYQVDNETKHYEVSGPAIQTMFAKFMKGRYESLDAMNHHLGLDYWSNRINAWEDFPSMDMTINASLSGEFETFRRKLVTDFLAWQVGIVNEYRKEDQFVTQNFDFDWRGYSYGVQTFVNHYEAAAPFTVVGCDIYHPTQDELTGCEIAFGGDITRCLKNDNYFVIETEAQGHAGWLPYPGQLRLQAFSHLASGANMVAYWHWHSTHNSFETYWKGLLSQDFSPSPTYVEATTIGSDFARLSDKLVDLKKDNKVAVLINNEALSAFNWFKVYYDMDYNDIFRQMFDALYKMNVECDIIDISYPDFTDYDMIVAAPLYAVADEILERLNAYVEQGGHIVYTIRSGFSDDKVKVRSVAQPGIISEACGNFFSQHTEAKQTVIKSDILTIDEANQNLRGWIELLTAKDAEVLATYGHKHWGSYAAITTNNYGKGSATYVGCCPTEAVYSELFSYILNKTGMKTIDQTLAFPTIVRKGTNTAGNKIIYIFNYSDEPVTVTYPYEDATELISGDAIVSGSDVELSAWGFGIYEIEA